MTDRKRAEALRTGVPKPFYLNIAELYMDMVSGTWLNMPFGTRLDEIDEYELAVMQAAEISRRVWLVWNKSDKTRTASDYEFMRWANKCLSD